MWESGTTGRSYMRIIICGAGEVGSQASEVLDGKGHSITMIDQDAARLAKIEDRLDLSTLAGNCAHADILMEAGAADADLIVAATDNDEVNLLAASIARRLGVRKTIARVHDYTYLEQESINYSRSLGIDRLICPEYLTAGAIAQSLRNPAALAVENFAGGQVEMQQFRTPSGAKAIGQLLADLPLPSGARIAAISRGREVVIPDGSLRIEEKDIIFLVANADVFDTAYKLFAGKAFTRQKVVINGGTTLAEWVCRFLRGRNFSVRLFERDADKAEALAAKLDWVTVLHGDPTDAAVFQEERIGEVDDFVSLLDDDEDNIIGAVLAKSRGVRQVISIVQRSHYLDLLYDIGVDRAFSPRVVAEPSSSPPTGRSSRSREVTKPRSPPRMIPSNPATWFWCSAEASPNRNFASSSTPPEDSSLESWSCRQKSRSVRLGAFRSDGSVLALVAALGVPGGCR